MFRPEFLNRVDAVVVFKSLTTEQIRQIVDLQLGRLQRHLTEQSIKLEVRGRPRTCSPRRATTASSGPGRRAG